MAIYKRGKKGPVVGHGTFTRLGTTKTERRVGARCPFLSQTVGFPGGVPEAIGMEATNRRLLIRLVLLVGGNLQMPEAEGPKVTV